MILCGRKLWDGSGGNNHAIEHYEQTKYPLAVKLGTITADLEAAGNCTTEILQFTFLFFCVWKFHDMKFCLRAMYQTFIVIFI